MATKAVDTTGTASARRAAGMGTGRSVAAIGDRTATTVAKADTSLASATNRSAREAATLVSAITVALRATSRATAPNPRRSAPSAAAVVVVAAEAEARRATTAALRRT